MPLIVGASLTSGTANAYTKLLSVVGEGLGENAYPVSKLQFSFDQITWEDGQTPISWSDTAASCYVYSVSFARMVYEPLYVRAITSDNEVSSAYKIAATIPARQRVFNAIEYGMGLITEASGYYNTVMRVYREPMALDKIPEFPAIIIMDGPEECSNINNHLQYGGNEALLFNQLDIELQCIVQKTDYPMIARNKMLADLQKYFGTHYWLPDADGVVSAFNSIYLRSDPWGIHETKPLTGIGAWFRVWYRQKLTDPNTLG
jgi:hypothetical protein